MSGDDKQKTPQPKLTVPLLSEPQFGKTSLLLQQQAQKQLKIQLVSQSQIRPASASTPGAIGRVVIPTSGTGGKPAAVLTVAQASGQKVRVQSAGQSKSKPPPVIISQQVQSPTAVLTVAQALPSGQKVRAQSAAQSKSKPVVSQQAQSPATVAQATGQKVRVQSAVQSKSKPAVTSVSQVQSPSSMPHAVNVKGTPRLKPPPPYPTDLGPPNPLYGPLLETAESILMESNGKPLHAQEIKCKMLEKNLLDVSTISLLDQAMNREVQLGSHRFRKIEGGLFTLISAQPSPPHRATTNVKPSPTNSFGNHIGSALAATSHRPADKDYKKYRKLKKFVKHTIFLNASLCDEVSRVEEKLAAYKEERRFLLRRVLQHEMVQSTKNQQSSPGTSQTAMLKKLVSSLTPVVAANAPEGHHPKERPKKRSNSTPNISITKPKTTKELLETLKPKPKKAAKTSKRTVKLVPLDSSGRPIFPILLGGLTVHSLGEVVSDRPCFHSPENIFPVGFCSTRTYASLKNPDQKCLYTCKILDDGTGPVFEISPEDDPKYVLMGSTASECHGKLLHLVNKARGADILDVRGKGPAFFGFSHPTIQNLIQSSPGARKCSSYRWVKYEVTKCESFVDNQFLPMDTDPTVNFDTLHMNPAFKAAGPKLGSSTPSLSSTSLRNLLTSGPIKTEPS